MIAIIAIAALTRINVVADRVGGIVYSKGNDLYFFIAESHTGLVGHVLLESVPELERNLGKVHSFRQLLINAVTRHLEF